jgi:hypothetical protein
MKNGFDNKVKVSIDKDELENVLKVYKRVKKYMKSSLYEIKKIDRTETTVKSLLEEN